jgi:hypothetical protein
MDLVVGIHLDGLSLLESEIQLLRGLLFLLLDLFLNLSAQSGLEKGLCHHDSA